MVILAGIVALTLPVVLAEAGGFNETYPRLIANLRELFYGIDDRLLGPTAEKAVAEVADPAAAPADAGAAALSVGLTVVEGVFAAVTVFVVAYYWLTERVQIKRAFTSLFPRARRQRVGTMWNEVEQVLGGWVRGQITLMLFIGVATALGYTLLGLKYALVLGIVAGLLEVVPLVGPFLGAIPAILVALTQDVQLALWVALFNLVIIGESARPAGCRQHRVQLARQLARAAQHVARMRHVVDHREDTVTPRLLAHPVEHHFRQRRGAADDQPVLDQLVVIDSRIGGRSEELVDPLARRLEAPADVLIRPESALEAPRAQHQIGPEQGAVCDVECVGSRHAQQLERTLGALVVADPHVHPGELVQHLVVHRRLAVHLDECLRGVEVVLGFVVQATDREPREVDHLLVRGRVTRQLRDLSKLDDGGAQARHRSRHDEPRLRALRSPRAPLRREPVW